MGCGVAARHSRGASAQLAPPSRDSDQFGLWVLLLLLDVRAVADRGMGRRGHRGRRTDGSVSQLQDRQRHRRSVGGRDLDRVSASDEPILVRRPSGSGPSLTTAGRPPLIGDQDGPTTGTLDEHRRLQIRVPIARRHGARPGSRSRASGPAPEGEAARGRGGRRAPRAAAAGAPPSSAVRVMARPRRSSRSGARGRSPRRLALVDLPGAAPGSGHLSTRGLPSGSWAQCSLNCGRVLQGYA